MLQLLYRLSTLNRVGCKASGFLYKYLARKRALHFTIFDKL